MAFDQPQPFDPKADFASRIARIQAGGLNTNRTLFVGDAEALALPPGTFVRKRRKSRVGRMFLGLLTGGVTVIAALMVSSGLI